MVRAPSARVERSGALQPWAAEEPTLVPTNHRGQRLVLLLLAVTLAACKPQHHTGCPQPGPCEQQPGPKQAFPSKSVWDRAALPELCGLSTESHVLFPAHPACFSSPGPAPSPPGSAAGGGSPRRPQCCHQRLVTVRLQSTFTSPGEAPCYGYEHAEAAGPHPGVRDGAGGAHLLKQEAGAAAQPRNHRASSFTRCFPYTQIVGAETPHLT